MKSYEKNLKLDTTTFLYRETVPLWNVSFVKRQMEKQKITKKLKEGNVLHVYICTYMCIVLI